MATEPLRAPFTWFGGKGHVASLVWQRLGQVKHYIEPFCGSAAVLLAAPRPASLEVIGDLNGFVANFWRATKYQPAAVADEADYPVSHIDLGARHRWLMEQRATLADALQDPLWPGDARVAGWWLWGQCAWIGDGWCDWGRAAGPVSAQCKIPQINDCGRGLQGHGQIPHASDAGRGVQALGGRHGTLDWIARLSARLARVRAIHGDWARCMNTHYGTHANGALAAFLDPPYAHYEGLYGGGSVHGVAGEVEAWCREHPGLRIALCGHLGDYDLPGWDVLPWKRNRLTYGSDKTRDQEAIWFSPGCLSTAQQTLF